MQDSKIHFIHERFNNLVKLAAQLEKTPRRFGTDEPLSSREIHIIEASGDNGEIFSVTDLARLLGITKGAVSQNLKKMEKRGLTTGVFCSSLATFCAFSKKKGPINTSEFLRLSSFSKL